HRGPLGSPVFRTARLANRPLGARGGARGQGQQGPDIQGRRRRPAPMAGRGARADLGLGGGTQCSGRRWQDAVGGSPEYCEKIPLSPARALLGRELIKCEATATVGTDSRGTVSRAVCKAPDSRRNRCNTEVAGFANNGCERMQQRVAAPAIVCSWEIAP